MAAHELDPDDSTMLLLEALESTRQTNKQICNQVQFARDMHNVGGELGDVG